MSSPLVPDAHLIHEYLGPAVDVLASGKVIVYPTDTLYALGVDATNPHAVNLLRTIKGREASKPILALVSDLEMLAQYAHVTTLAQELAERYLPGPLTLVLEAKNNLLHPIAGADGSVGFRIPDMPFCLALSRAFGKPITSTSMNLSGREQERTLEGMCVQIGENARHISLLCDFGTLPPSKPSTIVDVRGVQPVVLREGVVRIHTL